MRFPVHRCRHPRHQDGGRERYSRDGVRWSVSDPAVAILRRIHPEADERLEWEVGTKRSDVSCARWPPPPSPPFNLREMFDLAHPPLFVYLMVWLEIEMPWGPGVKKLRAPGDCETGRDFGNGGLIYQYSLIYDYVSCMETDASDCDTVRHYRWKSARLQNKRLC
ncbi:hypothetical protein CCMA1212_002230 [Trichoderma ghanense]|uniref:Uncharacterized protein n=1 Tax=Trichoderma ghanense TaxID=65468 RepID=A0ABY2HE69_9HYPO